MKTVGLIGGTGWVSTLEYYRLLNIEVNNRLGGLNAAKCLLYSFNYQELADLNQKGDHVGILKMVADAAKTLEKSGADCIVLCANTLHYYADNLQKQISKPIIHIAAAAANEIKAKGLSKIGLLGTKITMEEDFYKARLIENGIDTIVPSESERVFIHQAIINELLKDVFLNKTKEQFIDIISRLQQQGVEGIVLGCTEIPLLIKQSDVSIPVINTLEVHVKSIVKYALE